MFPLASTYEEIPVYDVNVNQNREERERGEGRGERRDREEGRRRARISIPELLFGSSVGSASVHDLPSSDDVVV